MRSKKKPEHYVDNKEFLAALSEYKRNVQDALTEEAPRPMIPNYIGECFLKIAQHLSYRPNFINYPFREDMISDGIENCVQYIATLILIVVTHLHTYPDHLLCIPEKNPKRKEATRN